MTKQKARPRRLDLEVDKLTNSIENKLTGKSVETEVIRLHKDDLLTLRGLKWAFDWAAELDEPLREVHALTSKGNSAFWHGLVSSEDKSDHIFMHLIESAPFNKGRNKLFTGVMGNLVAFLCKTSFEKGYWGNVVFDAKTRLVEHYEQALGAKRITSTRLFIDPQQSLVLVKQYFPDFHYDRL
jgi:hypothetical protein